MSEANEADFFAKAPRHACAGGTCKSPLLIYLRVLALNICKLVTPRETPAHWRQVQKLISKGPRGGNHLKTLRQCIGSRHYSFSRL